MTTHIQYNVLPQEREHGDDHTPKEEAVQLKEILWRLDRNGDGVELKETKLSAADFETLAKQVDTFIVEYGKLKKYHESFQNNFFHDQKIKIMKLLKLGPNECQNCMGDRDEITRHEERPASDILITLTHRVDVTDPRLATNEVVIETTGHPENSRIWFKDLNDDGKVDMVTVEETNEIGTPLGKGYSFYLYRGPEIKRDLARYNEKHRNPDYYHAYGYTASGDLYNLSGFPDPSPAETGIYNWNISKTDTIAGAVLVYTNRAVSDVRIEALFGLGDRLIKKEKGPSTTPDVSVEELRNFLNLISIRSYPPSWRE